MIFGGLLGHQQHENEIHGAAVGGVERQRLSEAKEGAERLLETLDAAMWNRDALAKPG